MPIPFTCPSCGYSASVEDAMGGRQGKCPQCQAVLVVPVKPPPVSADDRSTETDETPWWKPQKAAAWIGSILVGLVLLGALAEAAFPAGGLLWLVLVAVSVVLIWAFSPQARQKDDAKKRRIEDYLASRSDSEILQSIDKKLSDLNEVNDKLGCLLTIVVILVILSAISALIAVNSNTY